MANTNPYKARIAKARKRLNQIKVSDLDDVRRALSMAMIELCERISDVDRQRSDEEICRLSNTLARVSGELRGIFESVEVNDRLEKIEKEYFNKGAGYGGARA